MPQSNSVLCTLPYFAAPSCEEAAAVRCKRTVDQAQVALPRVRGAGPAARPYPLAVAAGLAAVAAPRPRSISPPRLRPRLAPPGLAAVPVSVQIPPLGSLHSRTGGSISSPPPWSCSARPRWPSWELRWTPVASGERARPAGVPTAPAPRLFPGRRCRRLLPFDVSVLVGFSAFG